MKNLMAFALIMLFSGASFAEREVITRFRQAAIRAVEIAESKGVVEVQGIRLSDIKAAAKTALIIHYPNVTLKFSNRRCAMWQPGPGVQPHIYLNKDCAEVGDADLQALALHEILGLSFHLDRNYEISSEILTAGSPFASSIKDSNLIDHQALALNQNEIRRKREEKLTGGGAVGVGGGGDVADLRFKVQGLQYLQTFTSIVTTYGIPIELLELAIRNMKIAPASDIALTLEFRGVGVEEGGAIAYIASSIYRNPNSNVLDFLALNAARFFVLYAPEQLGLTEDFHVPTYFKSHIIKKPFLMMPGLDAECITWENPDLTAKMNKKQRDAAIVEEGKKFNALISSPIFQKQTASDHQFFVIRLKE
jgi:hypothetical protein